jgi:hypothetical protein
MRKILACVFIILIAWIGNAHAAGYRYYSGTAGTYDQVDKYSDTGSTLADKLQYNFNYLTALPFFYRVTTGSDPWDYTLWGNSTHWNAGLAEDSVTENYLYVQGQTYPLHMILKRAVDNETGYVKTGVGPIASIPAGLRDGTLWTDNATGKVYFVTSGAASEIGSGSLAGVSNIKGQSGSNWLTGYVTLKTANSGLAIDNTADTAAVGAKAITLTVNAVTRLIADDAAVVQGPVTITGVGLATSGNATAKQITLTTVDGLYQDEYWDSVHGGNSGAPTENYYGPDDYLGAWAMEFSDSVTETVNHNWRVPLNCDLTADMYLIATAFIPAVGYPTQAVKLSVDSNRFADAVTYTLTPASWTACTTASSPIGTLGAVYNLPITITAATFSGRVEKNDSMNISFCRQDVANSLTETFNVLDLVWRYKKGQ